MKCILAMLGATGIEGNDGNSHCDLIEAGMECFRPRRSVLYEEALNAATLA